MGRRPAPSSPIPTALGLAAPALPRANAGHATIGATPPPPLARPITPRHEPCHRSYNSHEGDLDAIFKALGDDPGKAKKYPPADATVFARK